MIDEGVSCLRWERECKNMSCEDKGGVACCSLLVWQFDALWLLFLDNWRSLPRRLIDGFPWTMEYEIKVSTRINYQILRIFPKILTMHCFIPSNAIAEVILRGGIRPGRRMLPFRGIRDAKSSFVMKSFVFRWSSWTCFVEYLEYIWISTVYSTYFILGKNITTMLVLIVVVNQIQFFGWYCLFCRRFTAVS